MTFQRPDIPQHKVDWPRLISLDFETYYDADYTLRKMSTSEYIRDPRFKAQMVGIKVGRGKTKIYTAENVEAALAQFDWSTHSLLCHNVQFDGFILSHHYNVHPKFLYDTLSMARGLHSNDIGAGLDEVSVFYGGRGKIEGSLEKTLGVRDWSLALSKEVGTYCANDVDEMYRIFELMLPNMPADEIETIDMVCRMFTSPKLKVDIPRVQAELDRELKRRETLMYAAVDPKLHDIGGKLYDKSVHSKLLKGPDERALTGVDRDMQIIKRIIGSNNMFADLIEAEGVECPIKISPAWIKRDRESRETPEGLLDKYAFAFAKDDTEFIELPNRTGNWGFDLNKPAQVKAMAAKQKRLQDLVDVRIAVKSTTNITRAQRFLTAGANGMSLPCGYAYSRAHTHRLGGQNKMNMQNLTRGGELRLSILAPRGYVLAVQDSGQIEARVNGWLWGQHDLMDAFRAADKWDKSRGVARGNDRDAYCRFGDLVYGREITTEDKMERFVGKVCIAEGELVLTDRGLVPIHLISKEDRLWDGVEWVTHDGVIDQGIREVITYDGLTATPDHEVFTEDGRIIPLGQAASEMVRLQSTGAKGQAIRFCDDYVVADTPRKRLSVRAGKVQSQQTQHPYDSLARAASLDSRVPQSLEPDVHLPTVEGGDDGRANLRKVRTFDIANAGPRRRYTVSGKLCLNCVLGLGFQMGAAKLQTTLAKGALGGPPVYFTLDQCKDIISAYRTKNHRVVFGWDMCKTIIEQMAAGVPGNHGPLNWEEECIWLPNGMRLHYPGLRKSVNEDNGWDEWSYQAKDQRKKIYGGLLCLGAKTQVLTDNGWKSIISVRLDDKLWDGTNWVSHSGLVHQGAKETISFGGVDMTPDHEVLVNDHWFAAEETTHHEATSSFARHYRAPDRHVDSSWSGWQRWQEDVLEGALRLRLYAAYRGLGLPKGQNEELRMLDGSLYIRVKDDARYVEAPRVRSVARHARPLQPAKPPGMGILRRAWDYSLSAVDRLSDLLVGYADWVRAGSRARPQRQLTGLQLGELPLGNSQDQCSESTIREAYPDAKWPAAAMAGRRGVWDWEDDVALPPQPPVAGSQNVRQAGRQKQDVFDLVDAGPLKRFTVRGDDGQPFIVHNCENIVQALARIIVMNQTLAINRKYTVVMTTHDEAVALAKKSQGQRCIDFMARCMSTPPAWCSDIPLNCEGGFDVNYSK